jgi:hypothetical protein
VTDYCVLADVTARLPDLDASANAIITALITAASAVIDVETQRPDGFGQTASIVRLFDSPPWDTPYGGRQLFLGDIVSVSQLRVKAGTTSTFSTAAQTDYVIRPNPELGLPGRYLELVDIPSAVLGFGVGYATVEVTGVWGWPAVPAAIKEATIQTTISMWRGRGSGETEPIGITTLGQPVIPKAIPPLAYELLRHYRRTVFA